MPQAHKMTDHFHPVADTLWGKPCHAIHIQPHLAPEVQAALTEVRDKAAALWPGALHGAPPHAVHVTIYPLVRVPGGFDRAAYWRLIEEPSRAILRELAGGAGAIDLHFHAVRAMPAGLVAVAEDASGLVAAIRRKVVETLPPPPGFEPIRYDLIHTTLARFASSEPVPRAAVARVESLTVSLRARVERLKLTRETRFPCLVAEELGSVSLLAGGS